MQLAINGQTSNKVFKNKQFKFNLFVLPRSNDNGNYKRLLKQLFLAAFPWKNTRGLPENTNLLKRQFFPVNCVILWTVSLWTGTLVHKNSYFPKFGLLFHCEF